MTVAPDARRVSRLNAMRGVAIALVLGLGVLRAGVARAEGDDLELPGLDAPDLRGDALVWEDAPFYLEPWDGGTNVRFGALGRGRREEVGRAIPVRIIASSMRTFVEVELPSGIDCAIRRVGVDPRIEALRLFVKRDDLAPVLIKPYSVTYSDGTGVRLAVGVPVVPTPSGLYAISVRGDRVRLAIPHASVGYIYARGKVSEPDNPTGALLRLDRMASVKLGGDPVEVRATWFVSKPAKPADHHLVKFPARCMDLTVSVPASAMRPASWSPPSRPYPSSSYDPKQSHHVLRGTPLTTPAGREVAVAADVIEIAPPANGAISCFDARLTMYRLEDPPQSPVVRTTRLCAAADHLDGAAPPKTTPVSTTPTGTPPDVARPPPDAKRTAKGVWYRVLAPGKGGRTPRPADKIKVHYTGWTTDGRMFDSSHTRGTPAIFPLSGLIAGWVDGMQIMTVGMKARFWIPEELAYKGSPAQPAGMLVFDVELLEIQ